jgi:hypothetical protein
MKRLPELVKHEIIYGGKEKRPSAVGLDRLSLL